MTSHEQGQQREQEGREPPERERLLALLARWLGRISVILLVAVVGSPLTVILVGVPMLLLSSVVGAELWWWPALGLVGLVLYAAALAFAAVTLARWLRRAWRLIDAREPESAPVTPGAPVAHSAVVALLLSLLLWVSAVAGAVYLITSLSLPTSILIPRFRLWLPWLVPSIIVLTLALVIVARAALIQIARSRGRSWGRPVARSALTTAVAAGIFGIAAILLGWVLLRGLASARWGMCLMNVNNLSLAVQMYAADNDDVFPPAEAWCDALDEYIKNRMVYACPDTEDMPCGYGFNTALDSLPLRRLARPEYTIVVFETDVGRNATGQLERLRDPPRHLGGDNFGFADGAGRWVGRQELLDDGNATIRFYPDIITSPPAAHAVEGD